MGGRERERLIIFKFVNGRARHGFMMQVRIGVVVVV